MMNKLYKRQYMQRSIKAISFTLLKPKQRLMPINNKQNSNKIYSKPAYMDGPSSSHERRPPRSLKHIQTQTHSHNNHITNVNALLQKNLLHPPPSIKKVEEPTTQRHEDQGIEQLPFKQAIQQQLQNDVQEYLVQSSKKNKKHKMLHRKQGRKFSNPDDFSKLKHL